MKQKQEDEPKTEQAISDIINAENFFVNIYNEFQMSAAIITFQSISPILKELNKAIDQICQEIKGEYDLDSTYMLPFMAYLNKINKFVETIEKIAIKNGIEKSFFKDDWRFSNRMESIKKDLNRNINFEKNEIDLNLEKKEIDLNFTKKKIALINKTIGKLKKIEKKFDNELTKLENYLEHVQDEWPIIEIINALYLNEPTNQYADDKLLLYDCSLKLYPFDSKLKPEEIEDWKSLKDTLLKIFKSNFYNVLSITSKENMKLKHDNQWEIKVYNAIIPNSGS